MRPFLILILFINLPFTSNAQVTTQMDIANDVLTAGENIRFTFSLYNGSDESLEYNGSSSWEVKLSFSDIDELDNAITSDYTTYWLAPGQTSTYEFDLSPAELYWPITDGIHTIYASYLGFTDSIKVTAPAVYGGELNVRYKTNLGSDVQAFKDSLASADASMMIVDTNDLTGEIYERWSFENTQVESLNQNIKADDRFTESWIDRFITYDNNVITSINQEETEKPSAFELNQNYPNPFNPTTTINFSQETPGKVKLSIFDLSGRTVAALIDERLSSGSHSILYDASGLSSGVYVYTLITGNGSKSRKLTLIK